jgi:hypothetical protein
LTRGYRPGYIFSSGICSNLLEMIMSEEHDQTYPPIPFSDQDFETMRKEDGASARTIALLSCSIFGVGLVLYTIVMIAVQMQSLIYNTR